MIKVLALDLEGTLISNAVSQIARPGLYQFLERVASEFDKIVMYTAVSEHKFRPIARLLVKENEVPAWFADIEYINWSGHTKDLKYVLESKQEEVLLVDDYAEYIHEGQHKQWIKIKCFDHPYPNTDNELQVVLSEILARK